MDGMYHLNHHDSTNYKKTASGAKNQTGTRVPAYGEIFTSGRNLNNNTGGLLRPCHEVGPSAEAHLPEWLPHLGEEEQLHRQLLDAHVGRCEAALGEDEEEEGGDWHANQWEEEGQAK